MRRKWIEQEPPDESQEQYPGEPWPAEQPADEAAEASGEACPADEGYYDADPDAPQDFYAAEGEPQEEYDYTPEGQDPYVSAQNAGFSSEWLGEEQYADEEEQQPSKHTIFKPRTRKPSFILAVAVNSFRTLIVLVLIFMLAGLGAVVGVAKAYMETAPTLDLTAIDDQAQTSFIYDAGGNLITDYKGTENRIMVSIDTMPLTLRNAFVAVEDARFYTHNGIDVKRIVGAFISNFVTGGQQGGSTITQQLIKNTLLSSEQSYKRKIQEAYLAMQLETQYTKNEILESYLNTIYLGEDYYGVKVAAYNYFGKDSLSDLTLRECAMLAGMTKNPYYYNPRRNYYTRQSDTTDYRKITNDRTDYVLRCMYENQFISYDQYMDALNPEKANVLAKSPSSTALYPYAHYVEYAIRDVVKTLLVINGLEDTSQNRAKMEQQLRTGGYHVYLALDTQIQETVERTLQTYSDYPALRDPADKIYRARNADGTYDEIIQPQAAAVVLDYRTGELKAIVGSRTAPTKRKTLNRASDMNMPVGSAIKPIAVYAPAIEIGIAAGAPYGVGGGTVHCRLARQRRKGHLAPELRRFLRPRPRDHAHGPAAQRQHSGSLCPDASCGGGKRGGIPAAPGRIGRTYQPHAFRACLGQQRHFPRGDGGCFRRAGERRRVPKPHHVPGNCRQQQKHHLRRPRQPGAASGVQSRHRMADRGHDEGRRFLRHGHCRQDQRPDRGGQNRHQLRPEGRILRRAHRLVLRHRVDRPRQLQGAFFQNHRRQQRRQAVEGLHAAHSPGP